MGQTIAQKIIAAHLVSGEMKAGAEIALKIDQTLTQDATGTMAYLEFESMGIDRVRTEKSVAYVDHNTLQTGFENPDDHRFIQTAAKKARDLFFQARQRHRHQVHLERFGIPGKTLIGSDSHTPTGGGLGMLAFGAGGMDVAVAMGGGAYYITMPKMLKVNLTGKLRPFVTAKDVSLEILRLLSVKGGVGYIVEWGGEGVKTLTVPERATITNMGAELGATTSIFPSDEVTEQFLAAQGRAKDFVALQSDPDAVYDKVVEIDLGSLEPLIAMPHSPDNVVKVSSLKGTRVDQVCIGSCTNSSLYDMLKVAAIFAAKRYPTAFPSPFPPARSRCFCSWRNRARWEILSLRAQDFWNAPAAPVSAWDFRLAPAEFPCARSTEILRAEAEPRTRRFIYVLPKRPRYPLFAARSPIRGRSAEKSRLRCPKRLRLTTARSFLPQARRKRNASRWCGGRTSSLSP